MGLMQLMPATAGELGCMEPFNPDENIKAGTTYDAKCLANVKLEVGTHPVAQDDLYRFMLASYNAGFGYVRAALREILTSGSPIDWPHFAASLPRATVRGRHPDSKQATEYALKIIPLEG